MLISKFCITQNSALPNSVVTINVLYKPSQTPGPAGSSRPLLLHRELTAHVEPFIHAGQPLLAS